MGFFNMMAMSAPVPEGVYDATLPSVAALLVALVLAGAAALLWASRERKTVPAGRLKLVGAPVCGANN